MNRFRDAFESGKLSALKDAAWLGFGDIDEGRFLDVGDGDLEAFIAGLGRRASERERGSGK